MFKPCTLFYADGYKVGHKKMLAPNTVRLSGVWIPRSGKHAPKGVKKVISIGQQLTWRWLHDEYKENFFAQPVDVALKFVKTMSLYLGMEYEGDHFIALHKLGYLPVRVKALKEGVETEFNIPHMTFINTVDGFAWLSLYLETAISALSWKMPTSATSALQYKRNAVEWVMKTDPESEWLIPFMCHDFSARGLSVFDMLSSGLGHAAVFTGSDSLICIPGAQYFYDEPEDECIIASVNASEHSVSTTKIFTVGERQMIIDWLKLLPDGIFSQVADTFSLWKYIEYLKDPEIKALVLSRNGKLVVRPDSGDPVDIICGLNSRSSLNAQEELDKQNNLPSSKGVIELLWDIFGGTINAQGYKVLDPHIGAIYGDSITLDRQVEIYMRLAAKGFAATNIVLGVGSFTYQFNSRDTLGFAAKGSWFEVHDCGNVEDCECDTHCGRKRESYSIYKDPVTDDGTKKSYKGLLQVYIEDGVYKVKEECTWEEEGQGELQLIYEDGKFYNITTFKQIRERINSL